jgi:hypothetical protein
MGRLFATIRQLVAEEKYVVAKLVTVHYFDRG